MISDTFRGTDYISRIFAIKKAIYKRRIIRLHLIPLTREELEEEKRRSLVISDAMTYALRIA